MSGLLLKHAELKLLANVAKPLSVVAYNDSPAQTELMPGCTIEALLARAQTVTPLLEEILHSQSPPHLGINK